MKENFTRIVVLVDRSGSMGSVREATVAGINEFISTQKNTPGDGTIKIVQFDDLAGQFTYEVILDRNLKDVGPITVEQFTPRGGTPLLDAMGRTINELGDELRVIPESDRPGRVLVAIVTDGYENASKEFAPAVDRDKIGKPEFDGKARIKAMVEHQTSKYNWQFTYVGANQDAVLVGKDYGFDAVRCMSFTADAAHTKSAFRSIGAYASRMRNTMDISSLSKVGYTDEERDESLNESKR